MAHSGIKADVIAVAPKTKALSEEEYNILLPASIVPVKVPSGVSEQPMGMEETLMGARNRMSAARELVPNGDYYVSIENGIFIEDEKYIDRGIIVLQNAAGDKEEIAISDGVEFPEEFFHLAQRAEGV